MLWFGECMLALGSKVRFTVSGVSSVRFGYYLEGTINEECNQDWLAVRVNGSFDSVIVPGQENELIW